MERTMDYQQWSDWMDQHIWPQIRTMMAHDALFKLLGYARNLTGDFNGPIGWLIDVEYVVYQLTAIRKQCEFRRDVFSLRRLLTEAKAKVPAPKDQIIDELSLKLDRCGPVCKMANDNVFHTADPLRRPNLSQWDLQIVQVAEAQKAVCEVAVTLDRDLLQRRTPAAIIPVPQQNDIVQEFTSWVPQDGIQKLREYWHTHRRSVNAWTLKSDS